MRSAGHEAHYGSIFNLSHRNHLLQTNSISSSGYLLDSFIIFQALVNGLNKRLIICVSPTLIVIRLWQ